MGERQAIQVPSTEGLFEAWGLAEAVRTGNTVCVSGQVGWDEKLNPGADLEAQARLAFKNLKTVLEKAGAKPKHLTRLLLFFVDTGKGMSLMDMGGIVFKVKQEIMPESKCAATGVRVADLIDPRLMLEIEATAVID